MCTRHHERGYTPRQPTQSLDDSKPALQPSNPDELYAEAKKRREEKKMQNYMAILEDCVR